MTLLLSTPPDWFVQWQDWHAQNSPLIIARLKEVRSLPGHPDLRDRLDKSADVLRELARMVNDDDPSYRKDILDPTPENMAATLNRLLEIWTPSWSDFACTQPTAVLEAFARHHWRRTFGKKAPAWWAPTPLDRFRGVRPVRCPA